MSTWAQHLSSRARTWVFEARIEGVGVALVGAELLQTTDGRYRLCSEIPDYAAGEPARLWLPYLAGWPDVLAEEMQPEGGVADASASVALQLTDIGDALTSALSVDAAPVGKLAQGASASVGYVVLEDKSGVTSTDVLYVDGEAMRVTSTSGSGGAESVNVARAYLSTEARPHLVGASVYTVSPFLAGRRLGLYVLPADADDEDERRLVGTYSITGLTWDEALNVWTLEARAYAETLDATVPRYETAAELFLAYQQTDGLGPVLLLAPGASERPEIVWQGWASEDWVWFRVGGELLACERYSDIQATVLRGAGETSQVDLQPGLTFRQVMAGNAFRYSPGPVPATSRGAGTWTETDDLIDLCLILLTSSRHEDDGLELTNYVSAHGNFSVLPPGWGAGVPAADIDWDSAADVRARLQVRLPNFVLGAEPATVRSILDQLLRPVGVHLVNADGLLRFVLPRNPYAGEATVTLDEDVILLRQGAALPDVDLHRDLTSAAGEVRYTLGPRRTLVSTRTVNPGRVRRTIDIAVPAASSADRYTWAELAQLRASRLYRPLTTISLAADAAVWAVTVGTYVQVTLPEAPDLEIGRRGWTDQQVLVEYREPQVEADEGGRGVILRLRGRAFGARAATRRICPSAYVSAPTGAVCLCWPNRFTEADAPGALPSSDVAAFAVGDVVRLLDLDGTEAAPGLTETIDAVSVGTDEITLSGTFGGALAAGTILTFALADDANTEQRTHHAYLADEDDLLVGTGNFAATPYSEP